MNYIKRALERKFLHMNDFFKVILVTGARQVGKTTMLKHLAEGEKRTYVTLDDFMTRELAVHDPVLFFQIYKPPIIIDEIQKAPQLFEQIKIICDQSEQTGLFWLTGSQQYEMMQGIRETLAGRVCILQLYSLSQSEVSGREFSEETDFSLQSLQARQEQVEANDIQNVFTHIFRGGMPQVLRADAEQRQAYYQSYVDTYLMRDVTEAGGIADTVRFRRFLNGCAALVSQQVNYKNLAEIAEISQPTAKEWLKILQGLGVIYLLQPFSSNAIKRLTKTPKLYFCDTGLCAWLSMWLTKETLMAGAVSGHFFENHVVMELVRHYAYGKDMAALSYYRDANGKEIDVLVEENHRIHPFEVKKAAAPDRREVKKFSLLDGGTLQRGGGGIICMCERVIPIDSENCFIPCNLI